MNEKALMNKSFKQFVINLSLVLESEGILQEKPFVFHKYIQFPISPISQLVEHRKRCTYMYIEELL